MDQPRGKPDDARRAALSVVGGFAAVVVTGALVWTFWNAVTLRVEYYDSFEWLNGARRIAWDDASPFNLYRPPLGYFVYAPSTLLVEGQPAASSLHWLAPHVEAALIATLLVVLCFVWFRQGHGVWLALIGAAVLVSSRLFVRYGGHVMIDVLTTLMTVATLVLWRYARERHRLSLYLWVGIPLGFCILGKQPLLLVPIGLGFGEVLSAIRTGRLKDRRLIGLAIALAVAAAIFYGGMHLAYDMAGLEFDLKRFIELSQEAAKRNEGFPWETRADYAAMLPVVLSPVTLVLAGAGALIALLRGEDRDMPALGVALVFILGMAILIGHSEIRYLYPALPAIVWLALRALDEMVGFVTRLSSGRVARLALSVGGILLLLAVALPGVEQVRHDLDPFFRRDKTGRIARWVAAERGDNGRIYWRGQLALAPPDPVLMVEDESYNLFHLAEPTLYWFTGAPIEIYRGASDPESWLVRSGGDGDVVVSGALLELRTHEIANGAANPQEARLWSCRRTRLRSTDAGLVDAQGALVLRRRASGDQVRLTAARRLGRVHLRDVRSSTELLSRHDFGRERSVTLPAARLPADADLELVVIEHAVIR